MAKATGGVKGLLGAVLRAGAAILGAGAETEIKQRSTLSAIMGMISANARLAGFIGDLAKTSKNPKDLENALSLVQAMAVRHRTMLVGMQETRTRLRTEAMDRLELNKPEPVNPMAKPQPRRVVPKMAPELAPAPRPKFTE